MNVTSLIPAKVLCTYYDIEISFVDAVHNMGLIQIQLVERERFIHQDQISDLEKVIRLYNDLEINLEGIDIVFNLLEKEKALRNELKILKNRLAIYEDDIS